MKPFDDFKQSVKDNVSPFWNIDRTPSDEGRAFWNNMVVAFGSYRFTAEQREFLKDNATPTLRSQFEPASDPQIALYQSFRDGVAKHMQYLIASQALLEKKFDTLAQVDALPRLEYAIHARALVFTLENQIANSRLMLVDHKGAAGRLFLADLDRYEQQNLTALRRGYETLIERLGIANPEIEAALEQRAYDTYTQGKDVLGPLPAAGWQALCTLKS